MREGGSVAGMIKASGVILPSGERRDLFVVDGQLTYDAGAPGAGDATSITDDLGDVWIVPGLVDAHCHIGLDEHGAVPDDVSEQQAMTDRDAGTLLVRDAGSAADTRWIDDRDDLPRVIRAGRHLARPKRYIRNYAHEIEPDELPAYVAQEAQRGRRLGQAGRRLDRPRRRRPRAAVAAGRLASSDRHGATRTAPASRPTCSVTRRCLTCSLPGSTASSTAPVSHRT